MLNYFSTDPTVQVFLLLVVGALVLAWRLTWFARKMKRDDMEDRIAASRDITVASRSPRYE